MARPQIITGGFYHVYNRGVDKRRIFMREKDKFRFVHDLFDLNDANAVLNSAYYFPRYNYRDPITIVRRKPRQLLVDILAYVLMPNHYHLLLRQRREGGVSLFMQKMGIGYTEYFNLVYERSGVLFQGKFKVKAITSEAYLRHLPFYIHHNPAERFVADGSVRIEDLLGTLRRYRWSSYRDYLGEKNFPSLLNLDLVRDLRFPLSNKHERAMGDWLKKREQRLNAIRDYLIEE